jgi:hypothetical protein
MSRGPGILQQYIFQQLTIAFRRNDTLLRFADLVAVAKGDEETFGPHFKRSLRRALLKMVDGGVVIAIGRGGPRDPHRYRISPLMVALMDDGAPATECPEIRSPAQPSDEVLARRIKATLETLETLSVGNSGIPD